MNLVQTVPVVMLFSLVASALVQPLVRAISSSSLPSSHEAQPTSLLNPAFIEASRTSTSSCPNIVIISLSTQVTIPDFRSFYNTPIEAFSPSYNTLPDGSLIAPPLEREIKVANFSMLITGVLLMLFLRNIIVSIDYIYRGRIKYKMLLYVLLASQLCGPVGIIAILASSFQKGIGCYATTIVAGVAGETSYSLMLTGILGIKAYRCLDSSNWVLAVLGIFQFTSSTLVIATPPRLKFGRTLTGSCSVAGSVSLIAVAIVIRFVEAFFICSCFIYALWKSSIVAQGRISIRLSDDLSHADLDLTEKVDHHSTTNRRGWWDYVPEADQPKTQPRKSNSQSWVLAEDRTFSQNIRLIIRNFCGRRKEHQTRTEQKQPSLDRRRVSHPPSAVHLPVSAGGENQGNSSDLNDRSKSPTSTAGRRLSRIMTKMPLFREVLKNELAHTAFVTFTSVIGAALSMIAAFDSQLDFPSVFLAIANWAMLSLLIIHNFGRVVARHEREAILHQPSAWDPMLRFERAAATGRRRGGAPGAPTISYSSHSYTRNSYAVGSHAEPSNALLKSPDNPFEDFERVAVSDVLAELPQSSMHDKHPSITPSWMSLHSIYSTASSPTGSTHSIRVSHRTDSQSLPSHEPEWNALSGTSNQSNFTNDQQVVARAHNRSPSAHG